MRLFTWVKNNLKKEKTHHVKILEKALEAALESLLLKKSILDNKKTATLDEILESRLRELFMMTLKKLIYFFENNKHLLTCQGEKEFIAKLKPMLNNWKKYTSLYITQTIKENLLEIKENILDEGFVSSTFNFTLNMRIFQFHLMLDSAEKKSIIQEFYSSLIEEEANGVQTKLKNRKIKRQGEENLNTQRKILEKFKKESSLSKNKGDFDSKKPSRESIFSEKDIGQKKNLVNHKHSTHKSI